MSLPYPGFYSTTAISQQSAEWRSPHNSFISIRAAQLQDIEPVTDVLAESFHTHTGLWGWAYPLFRMGIYEDLRLRLRFGPNHYLCLVAVEQRSVPSERGDRPQVVGTVEVGVRSPFVWSGSGESCLYISNLAVQADYRRHGIARHLLDACDQLALQWGYSELYLHVLEDNHTARRLYQRAGYQMHRVESSLAVSLLGRPRQFFLRKPLGASGGVA